MIVTVADSLERWPFADDADLLLTDPPYSARVSAGQPAGRGPLRYAAWDELNVAQAVATWAPHVRGWWAVVSCHVLAPVWARCLDRLGLYVFAPLPLVVRGATVRLSGDGPASWARWITVARPRRDPWNTWGALPGAYVVGPEHGRHAGGQPILAMLQLVCDYSRPGDLVADPCCGWGSTLVAALRAGRRARGADVSEERITDAALAVAGEDNAPPCDRRGQISLL